MIIMMICFDYDDHDDGYDIHIEMNDDDDDDILLISVMNDVIWLLLYDLITIKCYNYDW